MLEVVDANFNRWRQHTLFNFLLYPSIFVYIFFLYIYLRVNIIKVVEVNIVSIRYFNIGSALLFLKSVIEKSGLGHFSAA